MGFLVRTGNKDISGRAASCWKARKRVAGNLTHHSATAIGKLPCQKAEPGQIDVMMPDTGCRNDISDVQGRVQCPCGPDTHDQVRFLGFDSTIGMQGGLELSHTDDMRMGTGDSLEFRKA